MANERIKNTRAGKEVVKQVGTTPENDLIRSMSACGGPSWLIASTNNCSEKQPIQATRRLGTIGSLDWTLFTFSNVTRILKIVYE